MLWRIEINAQLRDVEERVCGYVHRPFTFQSINRLLVKRGDFLKIGYWPQHRVDLLVMSLYVVVWADLFMSALPLGEGSVM